MFNEVGEGNELGRELKSRGGNELGRELSRRRRLRKKIIAVRRHFGGVGRNTG